MSDKTIGDYDFAVTPTATSGLPVSLTSSGPCTVTSPSPGMVHITGAGTCTITASQPRQCYLQSGADCGAIVRCQLYVA